MTILGLITARGGSKGVPNKNIRPLAGKPLIGWTIDQSKQSGVFDRIVVSTDSPTIAEISREYGADVPFMRPSELATDESPHILCVLHALKWLQEQELWNPAVLVLLQPTSPLRTAADLQSAVTQLQSSGAPAVVSVCEMETHPFLAQRLLPNGVLENLVNHGIAYPRRQDLPTAYRPNGAIYVTRTDSLVTTQTFFPPQTQGYIMPASRSIDIDSEIDFKIADIFMNEALLKSKRPL